MDTDAASPPDRSPAAELVRRIADVIASVEGPTGDPARHPRRHTIVVGDHRLAPLGVHTGAVLVSTAMGPGADEGIVDRLIAAGNTVGLTAALITSTDLPAVLGIPDRVPILGALNVSGEPSGSPEPQESPDVDEVRGILRFDRYGVTAERGDGAEIRFADGWGYRAEIDVDAPVGRLWPIITDLDLPARFSDESRGGSWNDAPGGVGAVFTGRNENRHLGAWEIECFVDRWDEPDGDGAAFGWRTMDRDDPGASWAFELVPIDDHRTRLRHHVVIGPGPSGLTMAIEQIPDRESRIISGRLKEFAQNMERTVVGVDELARRGT